MARTTRYELGFNWATDRSTAFTDMITEGARRQRIGVLRVGRHQVEAVRRRVERGGVRIGVFLNTQADGTNLKSPSMLLCRAVKARGGLVVEDPDDAPVYADRALQFEYLRRAGISVPRHVVVNDWRAGKPACSTRARAALGDSWVAVPGLGLDRRRTIVSGARNVSPVLARSGFKSGQKVVVFRNDEPRVEDERALRFRVWYLFGRVVVTWRRRHAGTFERMKRDDAGHDRFASIVSIVRKGAGITGLDWFMMELIVTGPRRSRKVVVVEPPNALAGLGPGVAALSDVSGEVMRLAAERIVEVAWRRSRSLPLPAGTSVSLI
jgi:hypothetical protein